MESADRWIEDENEIIEQMADVLDDVDSHPSRLVKLIYYIETELLNKKGCYFYGSDRKHSMFITEY